MNAIGRLNSVEAQQVMDDNGSVTVKAVLTKQDEIIAKLNAILAAIEVATDAPSLFTALDTSSIKLQLAAVVLHK